MTSEKAYGIALDIHTNKKDFLLAAALYNIIMEKYPNELQTRFVSMKLEELKNRGIDVDHIPQDIIDKAQEIFNSDTEKGSYYNNEKIKASKQEAYKHLINRGLDYYYEYKAISISDTWKGEVNTDRLTATLNSLALEGWRLRTAVTNELGKNAVAVGGFGINSTADQTVLIMERCVSIKEYMEE